MQLKHNTSTKPLTITPLRNQLLSSSPPHLHLLMPTSQQNHPPIDPEPTSSVSFELEPTTTATSSRYQTISSIIPKHPSIAQGLRASHNFDIPAVITSQTIPSSFLSISSTQLRRASASQHHRALAFNYISKSATLFLSSANTNSANPSTTPPSSKPQLNAMSPKLVL